MQGHVGERCMSRAASASSLLLAPLAPIGSYPASVVGLIVEDCPPHPPVV
jgi:hypothetical protein